MFDNQFFILAASCWIDRVLITIMIWLIVIQYVHISFCCYRCVAFALLRERVVVMLASLNSLTEGSRVLLIISKSNCNPVTFLLHY